MANGSFFKTTGPGPHGEISLPWNLLEGLNISAQAIYEDVTLKALHLQCSDDNILKKLIGDPRKGSLLDMLQMRKKWLWIKIWSSLGCSAHEMVEFVDLRGARAGITSSETFLKNSIKYSARERRGSRRSDRYSRITSSKLK